jgi:hypothetical protein
MWSDFWSGRSSLLHTALIGLGVSLCFWFGAMGLSTQDGAVGRTGLLWSYLSTWWAVLATLWAATWSWLSWQSATHAVEGGRPLGLAIPAMALNMALATVLALLTGDRLHTLLTVWQAHTLDGVSTVGVRYVPAAQGESRGQLQLTGDLGAGSAERLAQALDHSPHVRQVILQGTRGLVNEALAMATLLRERDMDTAVTGRCTGPCAVVFMAGAARTLQPDGQLAFHQTHAPILPFLRPRGRADDRVHDLYLSMGVTHHWADAMVAAPAHRPLVPDEAQLKDLGVVAVWPLKPIGTTSTA